MESTLFWIGCGLGVYGFGLRQLFNRGWIAKNKWVSTPLHLIFTAAIGGLIGFVYSASSELQGPTLRWPILGAIVGLTWGVAQIIWTKPVKEPVSPLLTSDLEWVETSFSAILLASVIMYAVLQAFKIPSGSMEDTLLIGDHLFVNKFIYGIRVPFTEKRVFRVRTIHRGEVVVFEAPRTAIVSPDEIQRGVRKDFIKRAIGMPGDMIEIKNKHLYVNGKIDTNLLPVFKDPNTYPAARLNATTKEYQNMWESGNFAHLMRTQIGDNFGPIRVPDDSYFVLGDNRDGSFDSRFWGPLPSRLIKGKAWFVYWPIGRAKIIR